MRLCCVNSSHYEKNLATGVVKCIDDEIPFEIPATWQWVRFGVIAKLIMGKTPPRGDNRYWEKGVYNWVSISDMTDNGLITKTKEKVSQIAFSEVFANRTSNKGDLLMSFKLTVGRTSILDIEACHNEAIITILPYVENDFALRNYLFYTLPLLANLGNSKDAIKGKTLNSKSLNNLLLPLPNFAEQQRIVAKIEELLPYIEKYSEAQDRLDNLNGSINDLLRKSILQEAIQGRLVPQVAEEDSAETLLQLIIDEKQKLVKAGKLKAKEITDSTIFKGDDNKYYEQIGNEVVPIECDFEFPDSWRVLRLKDICLLADGERKHGKAVILDAKFLRGKASGTFAESGKAVEQGDNIILVDGENSGEVFVVPQAGYMGSTFKQLWIANAMYIPFVLQFIAYYKETLRNSKKGAAIPHLNKDIFYNLLIGVPPLQEQKRITEQCNRLFQMLK